MKCFRKVWGWSSLPFWVEAAVTACALSFSLKVASIGAGNVLPRSQISTSFKILA